MWPNEQEMQESKKMSKILWGIWDVFPLKILSFYCQSKKCFFVPSLSDQINHPFGLAHLTSMKMYQVPIFCCLPVPSETSKISPDSPDNDYKENDSLLIATSVSPVAAAGQQERESTFQLWKSKSSISELSIGVEELMGLLSHVAVGCVSELVFSRF